MRTHRMLRLACIFAGVCLVEGVPAIYAQIPDHPIITEVYRDPPGATDGPIGRDPANVDQSFIEIYLPDGALFNLGPNEDFLELTFYEVEGDFTSGGYELVNYRIDLPPFDTDLSDGTTLGAIPRPTSGVVVIGWVDYQGTPGVDLDLAGTPSTRVALINGGITSATDFTFVAMNGAQFGGTTNFEVPLALSLINMDAEATSGIIQNGSGAYLLVDRNLPGYVTLYDDGDSAHVPPISNADPSLDTGTVLGTGCFLDGFAVNDHSLFVVFDQPYAVPTGDDIDLENVLPLGGPFSMLIPQIPEDKGVGFQRIFVDVAKTTEDGLSANDDPVADALNAYMQISPTGPFFPSPGRVTLTTDAPQLSVSAGGTPPIDVLAGTTAYAGIACANVGGDFPMQATATPGPSSDPTIATMAAGDTASTSVGQSLLYPSVAVTPTVSAADGDVVTADVTVDAVNPNGSPAVVNPSDTTTASFRVLNPVFGLDANGLPFETTVFAALQGLPDVQNVSNEFAGTSLASFVAANLGGLVDDERHNGAVLVSPTTNLSDPFLIDAMEQDMPTDPAFFVNFVPQQCSADGGLTFTGVNCITGTECSAGETCLNQGLPDLVTTILQSADMVGGSASYADNFNGSQTAVRAIEMNIAETRTKGGTFVPTERVHFVNAAGNAGQPDSGLTNASTTRGFELALLDSNVQQSGNLETGQSDDFGLIVKVDRVLPGSTFQSGEFVFLGYTGGFEGDDIDTLDVPPHANQTVIIYFDLDNLHDILGIETISRIYVIDGSGGNTANIIEAFSLNVDGACAAPGIQSNPASQSVCEGEPATFSVVPSGTGPFDYQWQRNGTDIPGATADTYSIAATTTGDAGNYRVVVTTVCGTVTSNAAQLVVSPGHSIDVQPSDTTRCVGQSAQFSVTASGSDLAYQWRRGTTPLSDSGNISGTTTNTLSISPVALGDAGSDYNCVVSGPCGPSLTTTNATLAVQEAGCPTVFPPAPALPPHDRTKDRYLSFRPDNGLASVAYRVELISTELFPGSSGIVGWVSAPNATALSPLSDSPVFRVWSEEEVYTTGCAIVPAGAYEIRATEDGVVFSDPLVVATTPLPTPKFYGDLVGNFNGSMWTPPQGSTNIDDALATIKAWQKALGAPHVSMADIEPETLNLQVNFADVLQVILAFKGQMYPFSDPMLCP